MMASRMKPAEGAMTLAEMKEFAGFSAATQRYIRRALDIGLEREDALERWSRDVVEAASIRAQARMYERIPELRALMPDDSDLAPFRDILQNPFDLPEADGALADDMRIKLLYDLAYCAALEKFSTYLAMELRVMLKTPLVMLRGSGS